MRPRSPRRQSLSRITSGRDSRRRVHDTLFFLPVSPLEIVHERIPPACLEDPRALHQHRLRLDEVLALIAPDAWMHEGIHADRVTRARFDAHPTIDALERVDLVTHRVLLDRRIGVLPSFNVDALGRAGGCAEEAGRAAYRAIGF